MENDFLKRLSRQMLFWIYSEFEFETKLCRYPTLFLYLPRIFPNGLVSKLKFAELGGFSYQPKVPCFIFCKTGFFKSIKKIFFIGRSSREKGEGREAKKSI